MHFCCHCQTHEDLISAANLDKNIHVYLSRISNVFENASHMGAVFFFFSFVLVTAVHRSTVTSSYNITTSIAMNVQAH